MELKEIVRVKKLLIYNCSWEEKNHAFRSFIFINSGTFSSTEGTGASVGGFSSESRRCLRSEMTVNYCRYSSLYLAIENRAHIQPGSDYPEQVFELTSFFASEKSFPTPISLQVTFPLLT